MTRFARTELLLGKESMERLRNARVAVVGLGAVGSYAVEGLARAGVGHLRVVDFDEIRPSNINRQLYALGSTVGIPKVELARERINDINPDCQIEALPLFADAETRPAILKPPLDLVVDAIDSVGPKVGLLRDAVRAGLLVVSSMGAATRTDPTRVRVSDIAETERCPLARHVRKRLRREGIASGIRCVYSVEQASRSSDAETELPEEKSLDRGRKRRPLGSFSCLTGIFGLTAASEALKLLLGSAENGGE